MLAKCTKIPGVIRLIDWFVLPSTAKILIVMERPMHCADLYDILHSSQGSLDEDVNIFL